MRPLSLALLILLFAYAAFSKFLEGDNFTAQLQAQPLPTWLTKPLSWGLPPLELLIACGLLFTNTRKMALWAYLALMTLFTGYIAFGLLDVFDQRPCSCGGILKGMGWKPHLYVNLFFLGLSLLNLRWSYLPKST